MASCSQEASSSTGSNKVPPEVKEENLIKGRRPEFKRRLEASVPVRHDCDHHFEDEIKPVATREKLAVISEFVEEFKVSGIDGDRFQDLMNTLWSELDEELKAYVAVNREAMQKSKAFLKGQIETVCEDVQRSLEVKLDLNPNMAIEAVEDFFARGRAHEVGRFEWLWSDGNARTFSKMKRVLERKLDKLKEEMVKAQRVRLQDRPAPAPAPAPVSAPAPALAPAPAQAPAPAEPVRPVVEEIPVPAKQITEVNVDISDSDDDLQQTQNEPGRVGISASVPACAGQGQNSEVGDDEGSGSVAQDQEPLPGTSQQSGSGGSAISSGNVILEQGRVEGSGNVAAENSAPQNIIDNNDGGDHEQQELLSETDSDDGDGVPVTVKRAKRSHAEDFGERSTIVVTPTPSKRLRQMAPWTLHENKLPSLLSAIREGQSVDNIKRMLSERSVTLYIPPDSEEEIEGVSEVISSLIDQRPADAIPILRLMADKGCEEIANVVLTTIVDKMEQLQGFLPSQDDATPRARSGNALVKLIMTLVNIRGATLKLKREQDKWGQTKWGELEQGILTPQFSAQLKATYGKHWKGGRVLNRMAPISESFGRLRLRASRSSGIRVAIEVILACVLECGNYDGFQEMCGFVKTAFLTVDDGRVE